MSENVVVESLRLWLRREHEQNVAVARRGIHVLELERHPHVLLTLASAVRTIAQFASKHRIENADEYARQLVVDVASRASRAHRRLETHELSAWHNRLNRIDVLILQRISTF